MPESVMPSIISAISILAGSLVGAFCSYRISQKMHKKQIQAERKIIEDNRSYEEKVRCKEACNNANVIRLDIATAIYQSIRSLRNNEEEKKYLYLLPINKEYSKSVASLSDKFDLKELSYLYQLYGIIEKVNRDIYNWNIGDDSSYGNVEVGLKAILYKLYGESINKIILVEPDKISYDELYKNNYIREPYKNLLNKLDELCDFENYQLRNY